MVSPHPRRALVKLVKANGISDGFMHIVDKSWQYGLTIKGGKVAVEFGTTWWYTDHPMPHEKWTYLCGTFDGEFIRLFADGILVDSSSYTPGEADASWGIAIGNAYDNDFNVPFIGSIDEIRISKTVRSASEIHADWKAIEKKIGN